MEMRRGDLIVVAMPGDYGKPRPAIVIQDDAFDTLTSVTVLPLTSGKGQDLGSMMLIEDLTSEKRLKSTMSRYMDPGLADKFGMFYPPITIDEFRKHADLRIAATNWALRNIPAERVRYHTCWGSWHTPHTTDIPFRHIVDLMLKVKAQAYSVEAADVRHELDYRVWEDVKFPDGKIYIPGVIAHKTTTIEPPELVAHRIVRYANIMGRENVIAGTDCGYGNRVYPDIAWAKMQAMAAGAALATQQLWPRSS